MAYTSLSSAVTASVRWAATDEGELSTTTDANSLNHTATKVLGSGVGEANLIWSDKTSAVSLDLSNLSRAVFGVSGTFAFDSLKTIRIRNGGVVAAIVSIPTVGVGPLTLHPSAILLLDSATGWAVQAGQSVSIAGDGGVLEESVEVVLVGTGTVSP